MSKRKIYDVIIIGGGPGGLTTSIYLGPSNLEVLIIEKEAFGGRLNKISTINNYPGFISIEGYALGEQFYKQALDLKSEFVLDNVLQITKVDKIFKVTTKKNTYESKVVVVATGTAYKKLDLPNVDKFVNHGLSYCAVCDGPLFKNMDVVVVGGGEAAFKEATYLATFVKSVTIVHYKSVLKVNKELLKATLQAHINMHVLYNKQVVGLEGDDELEAIQVCDNETKKITKIKVAGLFPFIGSLPAVSFCDQSWPVFAPNNYLQTNEAMETPLTGLYAIGDVRHKEVRQVVTATNDGAIAALSVIRYLESLKL
jgi:thioredoxin reductase (NADPH)